MTPVPTHIPAGEVRYADMWLETGRRYFSEELLAPLRAALAAAHGRGPYPVVRSDLGATLTQRLQGFLAEYLRAHPWSTGLAIRMAATAADAAFSKEILRVEMGLGVRRGELVYLGNKGPGRRYALHGESPPVEPLKKPLEDRILAALAAGPRTPKQLAEELQANPSTVYSTLLRLRAAFKAFLTPDHRYQLNRPTT